MSQGLFAQLLELLPAIWWPFCRLMAAFSVAPFIGDAIVPLRARIGLALLLAVACAPGMPAHSPIDPFSLHGVAASVEQAVIGLLFGFAFQLTLSILSLLGFMLSSQMGLSMAVMNDPGSGNTSDVVSNLLYLLAALLFFAMDGHLVLVQVVYASFRAWPLGGGIPQAALPVLAGSVGWVMAAAVALALPVVFATFLVQAGFGMINRVAPALNLFSLGFPVVTLFGLSTLTLLMQVLPPQYLSLSEQTLRLLDKLLELGHG
jgi:flagellar biosynthetic protein FliR